MHAGTGKFGVCVWFPEHGKDLIAPQDLERFTALRPNGKVFEYIESSGDFSTLAYGEQIFHVSPAILKPIKPPKFQIGDQIKTKDKLGSISDIEWHFKDGAPIYYLSFDGKRSSRRYMQEEIFPAT
jgi:hypothetical protein